MTKSDNPYRTKLIEFPELILPFAEPALSKQEFLFFKERLSRFSSIIAELGSGSGHHLIESAKQNRSTLFVGFELRYKRIYRCAAKAADQGVSNIFLLRTFAQNIFDYFEPQTLSGVYINFPDPWDKPRWQKHKLITQDFLIKTLALLQTGGFFSFKTDHAEYFTEVQDLLESIPGFTIDMHSRNLHLSSFAEGNITTEFENLFRSNKLPICFLKAIKIGN